MNLEELRDVRRRERRQDSLQPLRESFYRDVADYVAGLKAERERAADRADDPFSDPEVRQLTDEIETAEEVVESIYERRVGKVVKHASFAAADMAHDDEGLTDEERELFDDLVARVRENRERVLDTLATGGESADASEESTHTDAGEGPVEADAGGGPVSTSDGAAAPDAAAAADADDQSAGTAPSTADEEPAPDPNDLLAAAMGDDAAGGDTVDAASDAGEASERADATATAPADGTGERVEAAAPDAGTAEPSHAVGSDAVDSDDGTGSKTGAGDAAERTTVRITEDVGEIYGVDDRSYDLANEDVVQLPADNARPLVEKDAAERL